MAKSEIIVDASDVSQDVLNWLMKDGRGFYIERRVNRDHSRPDIFRVSKKTAQTIIDASTTQDAWRMMERIVGIAPD